MSISLGPVKPHLGKQLGRHRQSLGLFKSSLTLHSGSLSAGDSLFHWSIPI